MTETTGFYPSALQPPHIPCPVVDQRVSPLPLYIFIFLHFWRFSFLSFISSMCLEECWCCDEKSSTTGQVGLPFFQHSMFKLGQVCWKTMSLVFNRFALFDHKFWSFSCLAVSLLDWEIYLEEELPCSAIAASLVQAVALGPLWDWLLG